MDQVLLRSIVEEVTTEVVRASALHGPMNSDHEAYAVILEELEEYWEEVKKKRAERDRAAMRTELIQLAAMACKTLLNLYA